MPQPTTAARVSRFIALLDIYDEALQGAKPTSKTLRERLRLAPKYSGVGVLRDDIARRLAAQGIRLLPDVTETASVDPGTGANGTPLTRSEEAILARLRRAEGGVFVTPEKLLTDALGYQYAVGAGAAVRAHISNLRAKGYRIETKRGLGYRLAEVADE